MKLPGFRLSGRFAVRWPQVAGFAAVSAAIVLLDLLGAARPIDDLLARARFLALRRDPTADVVVVEIDPPSLRAAGRWPWNRERFSQAIAKLEAAGAEVIAFDVDFSVESTRSADDTLQAVIARQPGTVILPTFVQSQARDAVDRRTETLPLGALSSEAVLASVNVPIDSDGLTRRYRYGDFAKSDYRASMASALAGAPPGRTGDFLIDFGIRPQGIPHLSFEAVRQGRFDPRLIRGRRVLIGATAEELGDHFVTPLQPTLPGVYLHALAFESLRTGRALHQPAAWVGLLLALLAVFGLRPSDERTVRRSILRHLGVAGAAFAGPFLLQALAPVSMDTGLIVLAQILCLVWAVREELRRRAEAIVRQREVGLMELALHEPETGLPNRRALLQHLARRIDAAPDSHRAVLAVGIDRFAPLRGAIGYARFTEVVRQTAARLAALEGVSVVAHLSTSVLGVAIEAGSASGLATRLASVEGLEPWLNLDGLPVDTFLRAGVAQPGAARDRTAEALLENASVALDRARESDQRVVMFDRQAFPDATGNIDLMSEMRRALAAGDLVLHYQPKIEIASGRVQGAEALMRWIHPQRGLVAPDDFISIAEETGMIRPLTEWALKTAVADLERLRRQGHRITLAVNVSGSLVGDAEFRRTVQALCAGYEDGLCLEITESAIIANPKRAMAMIESYRQSGLKLAIDDYGSGLSSLGYLKLLQVDELKVDKSLVTGVADTPRDRVILKSTIQLAHSLGMSVVAEGVETEAALEVLRDLDCDLAQGWLFAKAVPLPELIDYLGSDGADARRSAA